MLIGVSVLCAVFAAAGIAFAVLYLNARKAIARLNSDLQRFAEISDVEAYVREHQALAEAAQHETERAKTELEHLRANLDVLRGHESILL